MMSFRINTAVFLLATLISFAALLPLHTAHAEDKAEATESTTKPISIAVVDIEKIHVLSKAAKSIKKQVEKKRKTFLSKVKKEEEKLRSSQQEINKKRKDLTQEDFMKEIKSFEEDRLGARKKIQKEEIDLNKAYARAMTKLTEKIEEVCQDIAKEENIDLVITRQNIIVGSKSLDITDTVMERLNKELSSLSLK